MSGSFAELGSLFTDLLTFLTPAIMSLLLNSTESQRLRSLPLKSVNRIPQKWIGLIEK
jgi:hypothetical protein